MNCLATIASTIGKCLPIGEQFDYLINYERNTRNLREQIRRLEGSRYRVIESVEKANRNNDVVFPDVDQWLPKAEKAIKEAKSLEEQVDANDRSRNCWSCYWLSRKAEKKREEMAALCEDRNLSQVSYSIPPSQIPSSSSAPTGDAQGFESRRSIINQVMEALRDENINMVGICGMGGVGKTTTANEVVKKVEQDKLFKDVVFVVVSQNPNLVMIQGEIAQVLDFKQLVEGNLHARAKQLRARILRSEKLLIVLDDVWDALDLNKVGIPIGDDHKGCKILLTSRTKYVCSNRNARILQLDVLPKDEAWHLFKDVAGISDDHKCTNGAFQSTQELVAEECGGLPLAIVVVGSALNGKNEDLWNSALEKLSKSRGENIRGVDQKVFAPLKLSYDWLNKDEQECFLLCSWFEEDSPILIEYLVRYGFGLGLFMDVDSVDDARSSVKLAIDGLKGCNLLMDGWDKRYVKMHDVIRDFAISIARVEYSYMIASGRTFEWLKTAESRNYTAISIHSRAMHQEKLPEKLYCPKLRLLRLARNYPNPISTPNGFFEGMANLEVLELHDMSFQSLPKSLGCLTKLHTLLLWYSKMPADMSIIGELKSLEILSFKNSDMVELPKEIGQLANLKVLEIIQSNVIILTKDLLRLSKLEELYIPNGSEWKTVEEGKEITEQETIDKLKRFSNLQILNIQAGRNCPLDLVVSTSLKKFYISIGKFGDSFPLSRPNNLKISSAEMRCFRDHKWFEMLLKKTAILHLDSVADLEKLSQLTHIPDVACSCSTKILYVFYCPKLNVIFPSNLIEWMPNLEELGMANCDSVEVIFEVGGLNHPVAVLSRLETLWLLDLLKLTHVWAIRKSPGGEILQGFQNLKSLSVGYCDSLRSLLSPSIAKLLVKLENIYIVACMGMENVIGGEERETTKDDDELHTSSSSVVDSLIIFPLLGRVELVDLPNLKSFCPQAWNVGGPHLEHVTVSCCPNLNLEALPSTFKGFVEAGGAK